MSYSSLSLCSACGSHQGSTSCEGCQQKYCYECLTNHREALIVEIEALTNARNEVKEKFDNELINCQSAANEIDRWARDMHSEIDRVAQRSKEQVREKLTKSHSRDSSTIG